MRRHNNQLSQLTVLSGVENKINEKQIRALAAVEFAIHFKIV